MTQSQEESRISALANALADRALALLRNARSRKGAQDLCRLFNLGAEGMKLWRKSRKTRNAEASAQGNGLQPAAPASPAFSKKPTATPKRRHDGLSAAETQPLKRSRFAEEQGVTFTSGDAGSDAAGLVATGGNGAAASSLPSTSCDDYADALQLLTPDWSSPSESDDTGSDSSDSASAEASVGGSRLGGECGGEAACRVHCVSQVPATTSAAVRQRRADMEIAARKLAACIDQHGRGLQADEQPGHVLLPPGATDA